MCRADFCREPSRWEIQFVEPVSFFDRWLIFITVISSNLFCILHGLSLFTTRDEFRKKGIFRKVASSGALYNTTCCMCLFLDPFLSAFLVSLPGFSLFIFGSMDDFDYVKALQIIEFYQ